MSGHSPPEELPTAMSGRPSRVRGSERSRVLIICPGPVTTRMAGPAIRSWGFASALSETCDVTLLTPNADHPVGSGFTVRSHGDVPARITSMAVDHDVLVLQGYTLARFPKLAELDMCTVVDLYDPFTLETLHMNAHRPMVERVKANRGDLNVLFGQLDLGDFFICGHDRQLDYWLGMLGARNRLNPQNSDQDPSFRRLIAAVPFGVPSTPPTKTRQVLKGVHPGISATDRVVLWVGGIWDWFDPLTPIRAMQLIARRRRDVKLVFLGVSSPDPTIPRMRMHQRAVTLSKDLGLHDRCVFFTDWVPYADMPDYLLEADIGTYMHQDHLEARYSIRTRIFDYIWAGLPMVVSSGDVMGRRAEVAGVARTVPPGDVDGLARTILTALDDADVRERRADRFSALADELAWSRVARPLIDFCNAPTRAADRLNPYSEAVAKADAQGDMAPAWQLPAKTIEHLRQNGLRGLGGEIRSSLYRRGFHR